MTLETSNGSTASYYELPPGANQLQDLTPALAAGLADGAGARGKRAGDDRKGTVPDVQAEAADRVMKTHNA